MTHQLHPQLAEKLMTTTDRIPEVSPRRGIPLKSPAKILHVLWAYPVALVLTWLVMSILFTAYTGYKNPGIPAEVVFSTILTSGLLYAIFLGIPILGLGFGLAYLLGGLAAGNTGKTTSGAISFFMALGLLLGCLPLLILSLALDKGNGWGFFLLVGTAAALIATLLLAMVKAKPDGILYGSSNYADFTTSAFQLPPLWHQGVTEVIQGGLPRYALLEETTKVAWPHITFEGKSYPLKYLAQLRTNQSELLVFYGLQDENVEIEDWYLEWGANAVVVDNLPVPPWIHFEEVDVSSAPLWSTTPQYLAPYFMPTVQSVPFGIPKDKDMQHVLYQFNLQELTGDSEILTVYWNGYTKAEITLQ